LKSFFLQVEKNSNSVKKFWSGWVQKYGNNDKNKIPPEVQDFVGKISFFLKILYLFINIIINIKIFNNIDKILLQKKKNYDSLNLQKQVITIFF
jgi:hypothetical protein